MTKEAYEILGFSSRNVLNNILREMWRLQEKFESGVLNKDERIFYNANLNNIQKYYQINNEMWSEQIPFY